MWVYFIDGVVLIDQDYMKDRRVFGHILAAFRYGREDLDVLGLTFRKELFLAAEQIYPQTKTPQRPLTRLQVNYFSIIFLYTYVLHYSSIYTRCSVSLYCPLN